MPNVTDRAKLHHMPTIINRIIKKHTIFPEKSRAITSKEIHQLQEGKKSSNTVTDKAKIFYLRINPKA